MLSLCRVKKSEGNENKNKSSSNGSIVSSSKNTSSISSPSSPTASSSSSSIIIGNNRYSNIEHDDGTKTIAARRRSCGIDIVVIAFSLLILSGGAVALWFLLTHGGRDDNNGKATDVSDLGESTNAPTSATRPPAASPWKAIQCDVVALHEQSPQGFRGPSRANPLGKNDKAPIPLCCQGLPELCHLPANQAAYATLHNAINTAADGFLFPTNHQQGFEQALKAGYRALDVTVGRCGAHHDIVFYHDICELGSRPVVDVLQAMDTFLKANPSEILWLLVKMPDDDKNVVNLSQMDGLLEEVPSLRARVYEHAVGGMWPTLGGMVANDTRLVILYYNQPSCANQPGGHCPAGWHAWMDVGVETSDSFATVQDIVQWNDRDDNTGIVPASCVQNDDHEGKAEGTTRDYLYRVNSFLDFPDQAAAMTLNQEDIVVARFEACQAIAAQPVNFYAVDYWSTGNVEQVVLETNRHRVETFLTSSSNTITTTGGRAGGSGDE